MSDQERADLETMLSYLPELKALRDFVDRLGLLIEGGQSEASAWRRPAELVSDQSFLAVPELAKAIGALGLEKFARMIAFLESPACDRVRTNNYVERVNRELRYEDKARDRWRSRRTTVQFLALLLDRCWNQERAVRNRWQEESPAPVRDRSAPEPVAANRVALWVRSSRDQREVSQEGCSPWPEALERIAVRFPRTRQGLVRVPRSSRSCLAIESRVFWNRGLDRTRVVKGGGRNEMRVSAANLVDLRPSLDDGVVDSRCTFLRRHVPEILRDTRNVLAVESILKRAPGSISQVDRDWLMNEFFLGDTPHNRTWFPLNLRPPNAPKRKSSGSLTDLLVSLREKSSRGLLLIARTGAGKTLAAFKAFRDCFLPARAPGVDIASPPLAGCLPLWLPVTERVPVHIEIAAKRLAPEELRYLLLRQLILRGAGILPRDGTVGTVDPSRVDDWVKYGPPILLFADLNAAPDDTRSILASALKDWQADFGGSGRHRVVATYRSARHDSVINDLGDFQSFDLEPIDAERAREYLQAYRQLEAQFYRERLRKDPPQRRLTPEVEGDLLADLVRRSEANNESLVSTPLIMHFSTSLRGGLEKVRSISDLYDRVVQESLERDFIATENDRLHRVWREPLNDPKRAIRLSKIVMTRVALAILARDPNAVRLEPLDNQCELAELVDRLVRRPEALSMSFPWQHSDEFWQLGPYQSNDHELSEALGRASTDDLLEGGLFRCDAETLGFVHDSLLYYFAGKVALRDYLGPGSPPPDEMLDHLWPKAVASRIRDNPACWERAAEFLGGALDPQESLDLVKALLIVETKPGADGVRDSILRILRGRPRRLEEPIEVEREKLLQELERMVARTEGHRQPELLGSIALHWLIHAALQTSVARRYLLDIETSLCASGRLRLRSETPVACPIGAWHRGHIQVLVLIELDDGRIVSGGSEGDIIVWDPRTGFTATLHHHHTAVQTLVRLRGGGWASRDADGTVAWLDSHGNVRQKRCPVHYWVELIPLGSGGWVCGSKDGTIAWLDSHGNFHRVRCRSHRMDAPVALASGNWVSSVDDGSVVWVDSDGNLHRKRCHSDRKRAHVVALGGGGWASSCGDGMVAWLDFDGNVHRKHYGFSADSTIFAFGGDGWACVNNDGVTWLDSHGNFNKELISTSEDSLIIKLNRGGIAFCSDDGAIHWIDADGCVGMERCHSHGSDGFVALENGGWASGGKDGTVAWLDSDGNVHEDQQDYRKVRCLVALHDGGWACGDGDGTIAWLDSLDRVLEYQPHSDKVSCLVALRSGGWASGGDDGTVAWLDSEVSRSFAECEESDGEDGTIIRVDSHNTNRAKRSPATKVIHLVALEGGGWASNGGDGMIIWIDSNGIVHQERCHPNAVTHLVGLDNGGWASSDGRGGTVAWLDSHRTFRKDQSHLNGVSCLVALEGGGWASGGRGKIVWDIGNGVVREERCHYGWVTFLMKLGTSGWLSCDESGTVAWLDSHGNVRRERCHGDGLAHLVAMETGRWASSGRNGLAWLEVDGSIRADKSSGGSCLVALKQGGWASGCEGTVAWLDSHGNVRREQCHAAALTHLVALEDGGWACGSERDGTVAWLNSHGILRKERCHAAAISHLIALQGGGWACGMQDGTIAWLDMEGAVRSYRSHHGGIRCFVTLEGGGWASGGRDGIIAVWSPSWLRPARLMIYEPIRHLVALRNWHANGGHLAVALDRGPVYVLRVDRSSGSIVDSEPLS